MCRSQARLTEESHAGPVSRYTFHFEMTQGKFCGVPRMVKRKAKFWLFQLRSSIERKISIQMGNGILKLRTLRSCTKCLLSEDGSSPLPHVAQATGYNQVLGQESELGLVNLSKSEKNLIRKRSP